MQYRIAIFFLCFACQQSHSQDTLRWSSLHKLRWEDFKGQTDTLSGHSAVSDIQLKYSFSNKNSKLTSKIFCFFNKNNSWVKDSSDQGLIHEQGHFDIGEIFARKFRKQVTSYQFNSPTINHEFKNMANQIKKEETVMDSMYEKQTDYHRDSTNQIKWNRQIANELTLLQEYSY
jgi:hypothetical protein